ncbi:hypothetical protein ACFVTF_03900 [Kitasatospora sp. NPDC057940]|uniref:hypothetical protein n=1 Tax=Kitasatospora sp. NPDC057940 TaxID=3346285 RepID=UPI0036D9BFF5
MAARVAVRAVAGLLAVALLTGAVWLAWWLSAERIGAAMGLGPPDGVVLVDHCYEVSDSEGYSDGTDCQGQFTPVGASADEARPIVVSGTAGKHRAGTRLPVRLVRGVAYEPSSAPAVKYGIGAGMALVMGAVPAGWLLVGVRRGEAPEFMTLLFGLLIGFTAVVVLGIVVGLLAGLVELAL